MAPNHAALLAAAVEAACQAKAPRRTVAAPASSLVAAAAAPTMVTGAASRPPSGLAFVTTTWCSNCAKHVQSADVPKGNVEGQKRRQLLRVPTTRLWKLLRRPRLGQPSLKKKDADGEPRTDKRTPAPAAWTGCTPPSKKPKPESGEQGFAVPAPS